MRRRLIIAFTALTVVVLSSWLVASYLLADTPQRHIDRYLAATSTGDFRGALAEWAIRDTGGKVSASDPLLVRRNDLTAELASARAGRDRDVTRLAWWRTCCEPGEIQDQANAGLARVHVTTHGADGTPYYLVFEIAVRDVVYWGDAMGSPPREWRLYEVHRENELCLFPSPAFGCERRGQLWRPSATSPAMRIATPRY
ncbi:MAG TPA: hypothetical protein VI814_10320 [Candidatus Limnocylindria bacterium]